MPKVFVISDTDSVFISIDEDADVTRGNNSSSDRLLVYLNYAHAILISPIKIFCMEIVLVSKIIVLSKIKILHYLDI